MYIFYRETKVNKSIEILCYLAYFIIITLVHTIIKIPIIVASTNLLLFFLLTLLYSLEIRKNILSVLLIYTTLACAEMLAIFLTSFVSIDILRPYKYDSVFGIIVVRIVCFVVALLFSSFKNLKKGSEIPKVYWVSLFIVPTGTTFLLFSSFSRQALPSYLTVIIIGAVLLINVTTFYLYDSISKFMAEKMDQRLITQQNKYYENQLNLMRDALSNTKTLQHDLKNKLSPLYDLALNGKNDALIERLAELTDLYTGGKEYASSGNTAIDSIINFKLQQAKKEDIEVACEIIIPKKLNISSFDIAVILGNLIDNAITGVKTIQRNKWIDIKIKYSKGRLMITINNAFDGIVLQNKGVMMTRKQDRKNHGLGLKSVEKTIAKYNGVMNIHYTNDAFKVKLLMYVQQIS